MRGCVIFIPTFLFQSCVVFSTLIQRLNLLWHIYVYDIFILFFLYLFLWNTALTRFLVPRPEGKHTVQTPVCAARALFYTCHRLQWQEEWQSVEELMQEKEKPGWGWVTAYLILHSNGLFFSFIRRHLSRVLQFFQGHSGKLVLLPLPNSSTLIPTTFPGNRGVLLSNLTAEENREVQDGWRNGKKFPKC